MSFWPYDDHSDEMGYRKLPRCDKGHVVVQHGDGKWRCSECYPVPVEDKRSLVDKLFDFICG